MSGGLDWGSRTCTGQTTQCQKASTHSAASALTPSISYRDYMLSANGESLRHRSRCPQNTTSGCHHEAQQTKMTNKLAEGKVVLVLMLGGRRNKKRYSVRTCVRKREEEKKRKTVVSTAVIWLHYLSSAISDVPVRHGKSLLHWINVEHMRSKKGWLYSLCLMGNVLTTLTVSVMARDGGEARRMKKIDAHISGHLTC